MDPTADPARRLDAIDADDAGCTDDSVGADGELAELLRIRGIVQGVGFRPTVWRLAQRFGLRGSVSNDGHGVLIHACGTRARLDAFVLALTDEAPPLSRIDRIDRTPAAVLPVLPPAGAAFVIAPSAAIGTGRVATGVPPDAATCAECVREVFDRASRRFRYPFTNCTHCGPRLSIIEALPYDRATTTMRDFELCAACEREYHDPGDRRFHAQPIACPDCGPRVWLEQHGAFRGPAAEAPSGTEDACRAAAVLLRSGAIVAIKGLGGMQLACDAISDSAVTRLRASKRREAKPFALMVRDVGVLRRYADVDAVEEALLASPAAPIVIVERRAGAVLADAVAPGLATLGAMLPNSPLHHLLLEGIDRPIVLTSGNLSDEPQCIDNDDAHARLGGLADAFLLHDRDIARRVDDSVTRVAAGDAQVLRRARGYAPAPLPLPPGLADATDVLAMGADLKNAFCLVRGGSMVLSHHMGDLHDARTRDDYLAAIERYVALYAAVPRTVAIDRHPGYVSAEGGRVWATRHGVPVLEVLHHHAHVAACLAEHGIEREAAPVLGIALDGIGFGNDGHLWGGEFLRCDYTRCERLASFAPVALPGGEQAIRQPWRSAYAHLRAAFDWQDLTREHVGSAVLGRLQAQPLGALDSMLAAGVNCPAASSCGRLFDAVSALCGVCFDRALYEGQAAAELEARVDRGALLHGGYAHELLAGADGLPRLHHAPMWRELLADLRRGVPVSVIAARFHRGLADALTLTAANLTAARGIDTVALSGGVWQNRVLLEAVVDGLRRRGLRVLWHRLTPCHDGGLALGQAAIAAAQATGVPH